MKSKIELLKTIVIGILMVSMVCMTLLYMNQFEGDDSYDFTRDMDIAVRNDLYKTEYINYLNTNLTIPSQIGINMNGNDGIIAGENVSLAYDYIEPYISSFFGQDAYVDFQSDKNFNDCFDGEYIYVKYRCNMPKSLIYYSQKPQSVLERISNEYIYDFVIVLDTNPYLVARSFGGDTIVYQSKSSVSVNRTDLRKLLDYSSNNYNYAKDEVFDESIVKADSIDMIHNFSLVPNNKITFQGAIADNKNIDLSSNFSSILDTFDMNPDKVTSHKNDDNITFFDEGHNLIIDGNGKITYSALSSAYGINIGSYIGYDFSTESGSYLDYIGAALVLATKLDLSSNNIFSLSIGEVTNNEGLITIGLNYTFNGVSVFTDDCYAIKVEILNDRIVSVKCDLITSSSFDGVLEYSKVLWMWNIRSSISSFDNIVDYSFVYEIKDRRLSLNLLTYSINDGGKQ